ncbi:MAG: Crp/Fnr family transcriptional regulator [Myxococcota bacterium]
MSSLLTTLREAVSTPTTQLEEAMGERCTLRARAEQALYHAGDPSDGVYILASGYARAYVGEGSASRTTLLVRAPAILGDRDVLANCSARDTVRLVTPSRLMTLSREEFIREWEGSSELRNWLTDDLARRYATTIRWIELDSMSLVERLSRLLRVLETPTPSIDILASMLGLSRRSIFRALAELRERGNEEVSQVSEGHEDENGLVHSLTPERKLRSDVAVESLEETDSGSASNAFEARTVDGRNAASASF